MTELTQHSPVMLRRGGRATPPLVKTRPPSYPRANEKAGKWEGNWSPLGITRRKLQADEEEGRGKGKDPQQVHVHVRTFVHIHYVVYMYM